MAHATSTSTGGTAPTTGVRVRTAGTWLGLGGLVFVAGLLLHAPPSADPAQFMATIAAAPGRWLAAHWLSALAMVMIVVGGLLVLTTDSRLTETRLTASAWALLVVSTVVLMTAALAEATVVTAAAVAGDAATFEVWQAFAEGHALAFVPVALSAAAIAVGEARGRHGATPAWASWVGALAGVVAPLGLVLGVGAGIEVGGLVFVVFSIVLSLWLAWFGAGLARAEDSAVLPTRPLGVGGTTIIE